MAFPRIAEGIPSLQSLEDLHAQYVALVDLANETVTATNTYIWTLEAELRTISQAPSESIKAIIREYMQTCQSFLAHYRYCLRTTPHNGITLYFDHVTQIRELMRVLGYVEFHMTPIALLQDAQHGGHFPNLPSSWTNPGYEMRRARMLVAGRIAWITSRRTSGLETYPLSGRYVGYIGDRGYYTGAASSQLRPLLPPQTMYLLEQSELTFPLEWNVFLFLVGEIMDWEVNFEDYVKEFSEEFAGSSLLQDVAVTDLSKTFTNQAMASKNEYGNCGICFKNYGRASAPGDEDVEEAVITKCGHVMGMDCLRTWLSSHQTCPYCRTNLCRFELRLPTGTRALYDQLLERLDDIKRADATIDSWLLNMEEVHSNGYYQDRLYETIWHMTYRAYEMSRLFARMHASMGDRSIRTMLLMDERNRLRSNHLAQQANYEPIGGRLWNNRQ